MRRKLLATPVGVGVALVLLVAVAKVVLAVRIDVGKSEAMALESDWVALVRSDMEPLAVTVATTVSVC